MVAAERWAEGRREAKRGFQGRSAGRRGQDWDTVGLSSEHLRLWRTQSEAWPRAVGRRKLERYFLFGYPANIDEPSEPGAMLARGEMGRKQRQVPGRSGQRFQKVPG